MKSYPSISVYDGSTMKDAYVFVKYDGSNLRFEWNNKRGWYKFGTRNRLFDSNDPIFGGAISIFLNKYDGIEKYFAKKNTKKAIVFTEFFGRNSFAGKHCPSDKKDVVILDICLDNQGFMDLDEFLQLPIDRAECPFRRELTPEFAEQVRTGYFSSSLENDYGTKIFEGFVCKGGKKHDRWMCKIKTQQWLDEVRKLPNWKELV